MHRSLGELAGKVVWDEDAIGSASVAPLNGGHVAGTRDVRWLAEPARLCVERRPLSLRDLLITYVEVRPGEE